MHLSAVIPAGGSSSRFGQSNKLLQPLCGKPLFLYAVERFRCFADDRDIIIPVHKEAMDEVHRMLQKYLPGNRICIVQGGSDRTRSVLNAMEAISPECELTAVHDAARPLISMETIRKVYDAAAVHGAAAAARKSTNTLKQYSPDGFLTAEGIDRETVWEIETPQTFRTELLKSALRCTIDAGLSFTDDSAAVEHFCGIRTFPVIPQENNLKITYAKDIALAEALLQIL